MKKKENEKKSFLSNLNERDKMLLTVVGGAAVLAGGGFLVSNSYTKMAQLSEEHATITAELDGKNAKISQKKSLAKQLSALNSETLEQAKKYYGTTNQGEFIFLVDKLVKDSGIKFKSVNYSESTELDLKQDEASATSSGSQSSATPAASTTSSSSSDSSSSSSGSSSSSSDTSSSSSDTASSSSSDANTATTTAASTATGTDPYTNTNITQMTADIEFEGTYTQVLKLLELIDGNQQKIVSSELELGGKQSLSDTEEQRNPELTSGKIKLRFYQVKDVERYVTLESNVDKTPIEFANWESPFAIPTWQASSLSVTGNGTGKDTAGSNSTLGAATSTTDSNNNLAPSYLEQLSTQSSQNNGLSAYYNSSTIYRFESPLKLVQSGSSNQYDVTVDNTDFLEGTGSNVVKIPATKSSTLFEMEFAAPYVSLNSQPDYISYSLYLSNKWQGETGLIVKNASGQKIYLHVIRPNSWTGWREVSFNPADIPGFSYPMTIMGYYFETPSGDSPETTMKLDNLAVDNLVVN
ncbi:hypothetical protein ACVRXQ_05910 [Streptococcus panodentis]|uniref:Uncharacterized protein n=1 Tax=Streptococcus panodentis TaxID=1581472 RepID=A0ABS5AUQ1_9STRE|nr:hypothetical protein [Streptococcus panodentis]MBP2620311.1 hypothetical protein [Streptococcus panodentis]